MVIDCWTMVDHGKPWLMPVDCGHLTMVVHGRAYDCQGVCWAHPSDEEMEGNFSEYLRTVQVLSVTKLSYF